LSGFSEAIFVPNLFCGLIFVPNLFCGLIGVVLVRKVAANVCVVLTALERRLLKKLNVDSKKINYQDNQSA